MRTACLLVLLIGCGPGDRPPARFAHQLAARFPSNATLELFASDARVEIVGDASERTIAAAHRSLVAGFTDSRLTLGRVWIDRTGTTAVVEAVFAGRRGAHSVGVAAAAIVTLVDGRATSVRIYVDLVTAVGQLDPSQVPGLAIRPPEPPPERGLFAATGSAEEVRNLAVANEVWTALDAHDAARVVASASAAYRYVDFAAPTVLDREGTRAMVERFLGAARGFRIVDKPVQFAAGEYVVTEMVEHATVEGKPIELHGLDIKRIVGGHVVAEWQYSNTFELLSQIGVLTPPVLP